MKVHWPEGSEFGRGFPMLGKGEHSSCNCDTFTDNFLGCKCTVLLERSKMADKCKIWVKAQIENRQWLGDLQTTITRSSKTGKYEHKTKAWYRQVYLLCVRKRHSGFKYTNYSKQLWAVETTIDRTWVKTWHINTWQCDSVCREKQPAYACNMLLPVA